LDQQQSSDVAWRPAFVHALVLCIVVWLILEVIAVVLGVAVVGRHGGGTIQGWDDTVEQWVIRHRSSMVGVSKVIAVVGDAALLGGLVLVGTVVLLLLRQGMRAFIPLAAYIGGESLVYATRLIVHRHRPLTANFPAPHAIPGVHETSYSYPSGHGTAAVAVVVSLAALAVMTWPTIWGWIVGVVLVLGAVLVAWSRLVLGVHWFSDVAFGMLLGMLWGLTVAYALRDLPWPLSRLNPGPELPMSEM
jgi:membrane-associated phospholipid phosphatase